MLITCSFSWHVLYERSTYEFQPNRDKAVELTDARRYVNMCKPVCSTYGCRVGLYIGTVWADVGFKKYLSKDTLLFVCLWYECTCTLTKRESSNI